MLSIQCTHILHSSQLLILSMTHESNYVYRHMNLQMSYELHRLYTFNNSLWKPLLGKHSASVLAHVGFYYSGSQAVVVCYKCLCNIDCSQLNDSANEKHRQLSPNCLVVLGNASDNVLLADPEEVVTRFSADTSLLDRPDTSSVQTVAISLGSSTVEVSLFKTAYALLVKAYSRSKKRQVFTGVKLEIAPVDRNSPDFERLR